MDPNASSVTPRCPIRTTLELISGKWRLLIIHQLSEEPLRFSQLRRRIPEISDKMLMQELHTLIENHLVLRREGPQIDYHLTTLGKDLLPLRDELARFGQAYQQKLYRQ